MGRIAPTPGTADTWPVRKLSIVNGMTESTAQQAQLLLVDDSPDDAELTLHTLAKMRLRESVHWVSDGAQAVEWLTACTALPKLVLLDLRMPKVDGFEVLRQVRAVPRMKQLAIVVMASSGRAPELPRCLALGASGYVVKPVEPQALLTAADGAGVVFENR